MITDNAYKSEVDALITHYVERLENDSHHDKHLMSGKEMLALLYKKGSYPYAKKMKAKNYKETMTRLQIELVKAQYWIQKTGQKVAVVFEGRDAAGKGGTIQRFTMNLNPRNVNYVALPKPTEKEQSQWYFQRYIPYLPAEGEISLFDRSWYNRACVEPVMGYCTNEQYQNFMATVVSQEQHWVNAGIILVKYWLSIDQLEQLRRFRCRQTSELRRWKLSQNDIESVNKWNNYTYAIEKLFNQTSHKAAPWYQIRTDDKMRGRIECIRHFLSLLDYPDKNQALVSKTDRKLIKIHRTID